jgi:hypothetical protein
MSLSSVRSSNCLSKPDLKAASITLRTYGEAGLKVNLYITTPLKL